MSSHQITVTEPCNYIISSSCSLNIIIYLIDFVNFAELLVETGPTQTQKHPVLNQPLDQITNSIRM